MGIKRWDIIKFTKIRVVDRMKVVEGHRIRIGPFPDVLDITAEELFNSPILHLYFVAGARKALGVKFDGLSFPLLAMLWVGLAYAFVQPDDPVLDQQDKLYHRPGAQEAGESKPALHWKRSTPKSGARLRAKRGLWIRQPQQKTQRP